MKTILYARVSTESQAMDGTIQSQVELLRQFAKEQELEIIEEILDDGYSGTSLNRPGLDQVRDIAAGGKTEAILVLSPDRLARKQALQIILLEEFKKTSVQIIFSNQQFGDSPEDQLMLQMQGSIAEYERQKILDRTRRGTLHATRNGQVMGSNPPYGYSFVPKSNQQPATYAINPQEAEIVKKIFDCYLNESMTGSAIGKRLMDDGIPSRSSVNKWGTSTIYLILKNETYTGIAYMNKTRCVEPKKHPKIKKYRKRRKSSKVERPREEWIGVPVPQIIEREQWEAAQLLLKKNARTSSRNNKVNQYMLRGLVICGECGSMAPGYVSNQKTYYSCGAKRNKNFTTKPHDDQRVIVEHKKLDTAVWQGLTELLYDPEQLQAQVEMRLERKQELADLPNAKLENLEKEFDKLAAQEARILIAYREDVISLDELKNQKDQIANQRKGLEARQKMLQSQQENTGQPKINLAMLGDLSERYQRVMGKADFQTREKIANLLINRVALYPDKARVEGNIPFHPDALVPSNHASPVPEGKILLLML
jgi:site-specific DNA recombinase